MRLFPLDLDIAPDEGFTHEKDIFNRQPFAEQLTRLVCELEGPNVLLLDSAWGTGKTTFIKMWRGELTKIGVPSIYFDAFANDYQKDAFLAIASQIIAEAERRLPSDEQSLQEFKKGALAALKIFGRVSVNVALRAATAGILDAGVSDKISAEAIKAFGDETAKVIDESLKSRLEGHAADQRIFEHFAETLAELARELTSHDAESSVNLVEVPEKQSRIRPLIFVIDELDRCRPSFALEVLEKIKHFFSVDGVVFVLVSSLTQLEAIVRITYGDIDARTYLDKFYQLKILFPRGSPARPDGGAATYLRHLRCEEEFAAIVDEFSRVYPLSFRSLERIAAYGGLFELSLPKGGRRFSEIVSVLSIVKVLSPDLYDSVRRSAVTAAQIRSFMRFDNWHELHSPNERSHRGKWVEETWLAVLGEIGDPEFSRAIRQQFLGHGSDLSRIVSLCCDRIDNFVLPKT